MENEIGVKSIVAKSKTHIKRKIINIHIMSSLIVTIEAMVAVPNIVAKFLCYVTTY